MNNPSSSNSGSIFWGIGLSNTVYSEVAPCLPLPSLPVFCGALDPELRLFDEPYGSSVNVLRSLNRNEILAQSSRIADLLGKTDVSYLNLIDEASAVSHCLVQPLELHECVRRCYPEAFDLSGQVKDQVSPHVFERNAVEPTVPVASELQRDYNETHSYQHDFVSPDEASTAPRKTKVKKKGREAVPSSVQPDSAELQEAIIKGFCEMLEDLCARAEILSDDRDEIEWLPLPVDNLRVFVNEIMSIRAKQLLHLVPVDILTRVVRVLDHQIHRAEGLSLEECERSDSDISIVFCALESIHASLAVMAHSDMPKQLYKEEIIERILDFSRHQIMDIMSAYDPSYRATHKPAENGAFEGYDDEQDADLGSASKKRRTIKSTKVKKSALNRISGAVNTILQKLCSILGLLKDLLLIERLSDSCILQLVKTCFTTFLVENVQLLQLKAIGLISGIFYSYTQHRAYVMDEVLQLFTKLPSSKRALRAYHLPDEEQRQIQMVTALLIQLVHSSANLPEALRQASGGNLILDMSIDPCYPTKCNEATTETCCLFWTRVLQRLATVKAQDASELKLMIENLVADLLMTLNLPEYPCSAPLLEVLCVLLLQNAGLKSKDVSARSMAIDLLGTVAARLKHDAVVCSRDKFWVLPELADGTGVDQDYPKDTCSTCLASRLDKLFMCEGCQRLYHADCLGIREKEIPNRGWFCEFCLSKRQLLVLQSYCSSQCKADGEVTRSRSAKKSEASNPITKAEIIQQMVLNYLQDAGSADDVHLFIRWFYLCLWYKDDPKSEEKFLYYIARLKSSEIVRDSGTVSTMLTRHSIKKITSALGQNSSFSRGFDTILHLLLASLRENSPVIRAKALRAVSIIVEADPEVLCEKRVQLAVEGRFCDSAISVREAALELVGRHIASHPDVGLQYFEKVAERIKDTGVSVRKRAIRIIKDMCTSNPNFSEFTSACIEIMSRVSDEECSIQDLVCKTFYEFWFEEPSGVQTQFSRDGSSVPMELAKKTEQMVELLRRMPSHQLLVNLIKRNLALDFFPQAAKAAGINPVALASVRRRCEMMCQCLLERILQVEEMNNEEGEVQALPYVLVLHAFCVVDPGLCTPASDPAQFVITLQPYLKNQVGSRRGAKLLESIIFIIDSVMPMISKLPQNIAEELEQDLKHTIVRHSFLTVVHACIKCLGSVSKIAGKGASVVEYLLQLFFKRLDSQGADNKQLVGRSLFCLGLLIRYGNSLLSTSGNKTFNLVSCLSLFKKYLNMDDFSIKVRSLQALGFVLIARPDYMLERDIGRILEATLSHGSHVHLKMQALQNMYEYLLDAESQMGADNASNNVVNYTAEGGSSVPSAAGAGDTNICGGIVQLYWDNILSRCLDSNDQVRQSALKIVEVVLRQGLVHPITCVPYLIALETDPHDINQKLAHHLLMNMNEKYPSFFESRLGDGLQMSFIFIHSISGSSENLNPKSKAKVLGNAKGKSDGSSLTQARLGVSRIYKLIRGNRISRNKFMSSIVRKFDNPSWNDSVIHFLMYCTETLALLPFTSPDEPLYLIYAINRVIQVRAGAIEANLKALNSHLLPRDTIKSPYENGTAQQEAGRYINPNDFNGIRDEPSAWPSGFRMTSIDLNGPFQQEQTDQFISNDTPMADAKMHTTTTSLSDVISNEDLQKIKMDCIAATALQLLLKLKRHLKIVYDLNDARCQEFSPTDPPKSEALSRQNIPYDVSDTHNSLPSTYQDLLQRYQEFKNALRDDTLDYSSYTANIKRKRPTPRKSTRAGRGTTVNNDVSDDDTDDEDWRGSVRKLSMSGRKVNNTRSRRRL